MEAARAGEAGAWFVAEAAFQDAALNTAAMEKIDAWRKAHAAASKAKTELKPYSLIPTLLGFGVVMALFFSIPNVNMTKETGKHRDHHDKG